MLNLRCSPRKRASQLLALMLSVVGMTGWLAAGGYSPGRRAQSVTTGESHPAKTADGRVAAPQVPILQREARARVTEIFDGLPLQFEANQGQTDSQVKFLSRGDGYDLFLTATEAVLSLKSQQSGVRSRKSESPTSDSRLQTPDSAVLRMKLVGANPQPQVAGSGELPGKVNYFIGNDPAKWRTNVPAYTKVEYGSVYPGVDLVYHGNRRQLEYDFVVQPGTDPKVIRLAFEGAPKIAIDEKGDLVLRTVAGQIRQHKPVVYQEIEGKRIEVRGGFKLLNPQSAIRNSQYVVGFEVGDYDEMKPLVIDPVLDYSTYLGGTKTEVGNDIAVDSSGNIYVTGFTASRDFPLANPFQNTNNSCLTCGTAFVTKIDPSQSGAASLVYSTYLGGPGNGEEGIGIAVDSSGAACVTGITRSKDFPVLNAFQSSAPDFSSGFMTKLDASGSALLYSTYLGGNSLDEGRDIKVDAAGHVYVSGRSASTNFPVKNAYQSTIAGQVDAFVMKFDPFRSGAESLLYSTLFGGSFLDNANSLALDSFGNAYVSGVAQSINLPIKNGFQPTGGSDAFMARFDPFRVGADSLLYSTYIGGTGQENSVDDEGGIDVDPSGNAYVTGTTGSTDFPTTAGAFQTIRRGNTDAFVTKIDSTQIGAASLVYSTYLGGSATEQGFDIAVDSSGNAYVTGATGSADFPKSACAFPRGATTGIDAFVTRLNYTGTAFVYSTYLGGSLADSGRGIVVDSSGNVYVTGNTVSSNFPTTAGAFQPTFAGPTVSSNDAFITKFAHPLACNQTPAANDQSVNLNEDTPTTITLTANDTDGNNTPPDALTYMITSGPSHGSLDSPSGTMTNGTGDAYSTDIVYTPAANYNGTDSFTFKVNDGTADSNVATVSLTITAVNDTPTANDQSVTTDEDTALPITLTGSDSDGDALTYTLISQPANGALSGIAPNLTYAPNPNYNGSDSFSFIVNDGLSDSAPATILITVTRVNDAPQAAGDAATTPEDMAATINVLANDVDVDGDTLIVTSVTQGTNGTVAINADGTVTYTPNLNFNGGDSFTYTVSDGNGGSASATVNVSVTPVNDPPVASDGSSSTNEDTAASIALVATDVDNPSLILTIVSGPAHGTLGTITGNSVIYTPDLNYNGPDSFTFKANDGTADSNVATISITVTPINDAPAAVNDNYNVDEDNTLGVAAPGVLTNDSDVDGDALAAILVNGPSHGALTLNPDGSFSYTPAVNFNGLDSFSYKANDGSLDSNVVTVSITVNAVNDAPLAANDMATTPEDSAVSIGVLANDTDADNDSLGVTSITQGAHGSVAINDDGTVAYTPNADFNGADSFNYTISDGNGGTATATVNVTITPINDAPSAVDDEATTAEDASVTINVLNNDSDIDGDSLTLMSVAQGSNGSVTLNGDGTLTYTPSANFNGTDTFTYTVSDGNGKIDTASVTVTVTPANDAPVAANDSYSVDEDNTLNVAAPGVLTNDSDLDGNALTTVLVSGPSRGTLAFNSDGSFTYTPAANFNGADAFSYRANDGQLNSNPVTVSLTINPVNDAPVASDAQALTDEDAPVEITLVAGDIDSSVLSFSIVDAALHGTLSPVSGNAVTYTPDPNYNGTDSFTFVANDGQANSNLATVSITVTPVNDPPVLATVGDKTIAEGALLAFNLSASDPDGDVLTFSAVGLPEGATLDAATGAFSWTPSFEQAGLYTVTFRVTDPGGLSASETITITVEDVIVNQGPVCSVARPSIEEIWPPNHMRTEVVDILGVTDPDNDPLTLVILRILQDEPTNTLGDGTTWIDGGGIGTSQAWVRAERSGTKRVPGNGRIYEIFFEANDGHGKTCTGSVKVGVPHDQGQGRPAIDDGKRYDSTVAGGPCLNCN